jgi:hypothetical protein
MNKTILGIIIAVLLIIGGLYFFGGSSTTTETNTDTNSNTSQNQNNNTNGQQQVGVEGQGRVVFSVTDAAIDMTTISEINLSVSKIEMHHSLNGWSTASTASKTYGLLALNAKQQSQLWADVKMNSGTYDQIRLTVDAVSVKTAKGVTKTAKLPGNILTIKTLLAVSKDQNSTVNFDFLAKDSLYTTEIGDYVFAPVVVTETQSSVNLSIKSGVVNITSGRIDNTSTVGMDIDGSVKPNFKIDGSKKLQVDANGTIKVEGLIKY